MTPVDGGAQDPNQAERMLEESVGRVLTPISKWQLIGQGSKEWEIQTTAAGNWTTLGPTWNLEFGNGEGHLVDVNSAMSTAEGLDSTKRQSTAG